MPLRTHHPDPVPDQSDDTAAMHKNVKRFLAAAVISAVVIPLRFYLRYGEISAYGWGMTIFLVVLCILVAVGLHFFARKEYHTQVRAQNNWSDQIGAFWLVSCAFGPLLGWIITAFFPITAASWQELYVLRVICAAGLPLITALPLIRYVRGKAALVALPLLVIITLLPVLSVVNVGRDLWEGPSERQVQTTDVPEIYLRHTEKNLGPAQ